MEVQLIVALERVRLLTSRPESSGGAAVGVIVAVTVMDGLTVTVRVAVTVMVAVVVRVAVGVMVGVVVGNAIGV